jgi:hypothetical protein
MEGHRLRVFESRLLRKAFGPKGMRYQRSGDGYITRAFIM